MPEETITLYNRQGNHNKFYTASIEHYGSDHIVTYIYGRIETGTGQSGCRGTKTPNPVDYYEAKKIFDKLVNSKLAKGYSEGSSSISAPVPGQSGKAQTQLHPQLLNMIEEEEVEKYINDPAYCAQEKMDGQRRVLKYEDENVKGINRKAQEVSFPAVFEEAILDLAEQSSAEKLIIDGEEVGDVFYAFDLMLNDTPYRDRYTYLENLMKLTKNNALRLVPIAITTKEKRALYNRLKAEEREGIVFKRLDAYYQSGRPSTGGDQLKFKFYATASCLVEKVNKKRSIGLKLFIEEDTNGNRYFNSVGNCTIPPNKEIPKVGDIVEIRYLYAYRGGSLYQPSYLNVRDDIDEDACTMSQLKYKSEHNDTAKVEKPKAVQRKIQWED